MGLKEIWIPEVLVVLFLVIHIIRPQIKKLWSLEGLVWVPLIVLGITVGIFLAYGIRPECIPMLVFTSFLSLANIRLFISSIKSRSVDSFYDKNIFITIFSFVILCAVSAPMFVFSPKEYDSINTDATDIKIIKLSDIERKRDYFLKFYGPDQEMQPGRPALPADRPALSADRPLIFIVPPDLGSAASIDLICHGLYEKGFTVITYSREGYDSPLTTENRTKHFSSFSRLFSYWKIFFKNSDQNIVNEQGTAMVKDRSEDIEFLLPKFTEFIKDDIYPLLLVGYGAGGSALAYISDYKNVIGVIAISDNELNLQQGMFSQKRNFPVMYLVSGRALELKNENSYQAVFNKFYSDSGPAAIAAIESAGAFDYQDFSVTHPVYSFLFSGKKNVKKSKNPISDTAGLICNFASFLLERNGHKTLPHQEIDGSLYVESKGLPGLRLR